MISKEDLRGLIVTIKKKTGKTQEQISEGAGYEPETLTQLLSKNKSLDAAYDQLKLAYKEELKNSTSQSRSPRISAEFLAGKLSVKDEVIAEKERLIQEVKANAEKSEKEKDRLYNFLEKQIAALLNITGQIDLNLKEAKGDLYEIESSQRAQHTVMMHSLERIEGEPGKLHKELSTLERASQSAAEQTGSFEDMDKQSKG